MPSEYFQWWDETTEQDLIQELVTEAIQFHGLDVVYLPMTFRREDTLYNEDILRQFRRTFIIEAYSKNVFGWEGAGDLMSKFGTKVQDKLTLQVSRERFAEVFASANPPIPRPMEGDLIYLPAPFDKVFEIKFVEHEKALGQFYPLGSLPFFELELELHVYNQESIITGNNVIDKVETNEAYGLDVFVYPAGTGNFVSGELVYQGTNTGVVKSWANNILRITSIKGTFRAADYITGQTSNSKYFVSQTPDILELPANAIDINKYLANASTTIIDNEDAPTSSNTDGDLYTIEYLVVGGGGGGGLPGNSNLQGGGGGGGGEVLVSTAVVRKGVPLDITVGSGGSAASNGLPSQLGLIQLAIGGGAGGNFSSNGLAGGSGGGAGGAITSNTVGGIGLSGNDGGNTENNISGAAAGGGGAGADGNSPSVGT